MLKFNIIIFNSFFVFFTSFKPLGSVFRKTVVYAVLSTEHTLPPKKLLKLNHVKNTLYHTGMEHAVAQLVVALRYKPEGRGFVYRS